MTIHSLIGHTAEAFGIIFASSSPADKLLNSFFRHRRYLGSGDRRFIADTTYGMIREYRLLEFYLQAAQPGTPTPFHPLLYYIAYSMKVRSGSPSELRQEVADQWTHAGIDMDLEAFLSRLCNTISPVDSVGDRVRQTAILHSFPEFVVREWFERLGVTEGVQLCEALNTRAPVALRVNLLKGSVDECRGALSSEGVATERGSLSPECLVVDKRINFQGLSAFRSGLFELQDEGSQLISHLLGPEPGEVIVDACAGGGGKSLHSTSLMQNSGILHAFDPDPRRLERAVMRARRAGVRILRTTGNNLFSDLEGRVDRVLVDAPCSGSGTARRNPWIKRTLSAEQTDRYAELQGEILERSSALVKPDGRLVYATCSLLRKENEDVVFAFQRKHPEFVLLNAPELLRHRGIALAGNSDTLNLYPHHHRTDGFFAAALQRSG